MAPTKVPKHEKMEDANDQTTVLKTNINVVSRLPFPWKLHEILEAAQEEGYSKIISWLPGHSNVFRVHQPQILVNHILPHYFNQKNFQSFLRQLNIWGFKRYNRDNKDKLEFFHEYFVRGRPSLCHKMRRTVKKATIGKRSKMHNKTNGSLVRLETSESRLIDSQVFTPEFQSLDSTLLMLGSETEISELIQEKRRAIAARSPGPKQTVSLFRQNKQMQLPEKPRTSSFHTIIPSSFSPDISRVVASSDGFEHTVIELFDDETLSSVLPFC